VNEYLSNLARRDLTGEEDITCVVKRIASSLEVLLQAQGLNFYIHPDIFRSKISPLKFGEAVETSIERFADFC
jgi:hypothetical protein